MAETLNQSTTEDISYFSIEKQNGSQDQHFAACQTILLIGYQNSELEVENQIPKVKEEIKGENEEDDEQLQLKEQKCQKIDFLEENEILLSPDVMATLGIYEGDEVLIQKTELTPKMREFSSTDLQLNFFPDVPFASKITFSKILKNHCEIIDQNLLKSLQIPPFIASPGSVYLFNLFNLNEVPGQMEYTAKMDDKSRRFLLKTWSQHCEEKAVFALQIETIEIKDAKFGSTVFRRNCPDPLNNYFICDFSQTDLMITQHPLSLPYFFSTQTAVSKIHLTRGEFEKSLFKTKYYFKVALEIDRSLVLGINRERNDRLQSLLLFGPQGSSKVKLARSCGEKLKLVSFVRDIKKLGSVKHLERILTKYINFSPCLIILQNFKSLMTILSNNHSQQDPRALFNNYLKTMVSFIEKKLKESNNTNKVFLIATIDKYNDKEASDNEFQSFFTNFIDMEKPVREEEREIYNLLADSHDFTQNFEPEIKRSITEEITGVSQKGCELILDQLLKSQTDLFESDQINQFQSVIKVHQQEQEKIKKKIEEIVLKMKKSGDLESLTIPNVKWDDVGGLGGAKKQIIDTIMLPQQFPEVFDEFVRPRTGLLFFGPPGTGKTLLAQAVATQCKMNFLSVKGPELLNMYIGQSEQNVRDIFEKARRNAPCVIFFDELDALAPARGKGSDSSQVMDRIVAQFLTELDNISLDKLIFVIGATNRPDLLDQSLLRPGRFDKMIYLGINQDADNRIKILKAQTRKLKLDENLDFLDLQRKIPKNFSGADFYGLTSGAVLKAALRQIREIESTYEKAQKEKPSLTFASFSESFIVQNPEEIDIQLIEQDFLDALEQITPSVSEHELEQYKELQLKFSMV